MSRLSGGEAQNYPFQRLSQLAPAVAPDVTDIYALQSSPPLVPPSLDTGQVSSAPAVAEPVRLGESFMLVAQHAVVAIQEFVGDALVVRERLSMFARSEDRDTKALATTVQTLSDLQQHIEQQFASRKGGPFLLEAMAYLHQQLGIVMPELRSAKSSGGIDDSQVQPLALELLELKLTLDSAVVECLGIRAKARLQQEISELMKRDSDGAEGIVGIEGGEAMHLEIVRRQQLAQTVLPMVQQHVGEVVQTLIPFLGVLRDREPSPVGFSFADLSAQPSVMALLQQMKEASQELHRVADSMESESVVEMEYRSFLVGFTYQLDSFGVLLSREHCDGEVDESDIPRVRSQSEGLLRSLNEGLGMLQQAAHSSFQLKMG